MAAASPTPIAGLNSSNYKLYYAHQSRYVRRDSPPVKFSTNSSGHARSKYLQRDSTDSDDDDLQPPPMLSAFSRSVLEQSQDAPGSPGSSGSSASKPVRFRLVKKDGKTGSPHNSPSKNTTTPAPSVRIRRVGLSGAPVRRCKRTPQSGGDCGFSKENAEDEKPIIHARNYQHPNYLPSQDDQENMPVSVPRPRSVMASDILVKPDLGSIVKKVVPERPVPIREQIGKLPLAQVSANTPLRPAPPPPPKMSVLEAATKAGGASTTRKKTTRRPPFIVNGKSFQALERCGKGGSAEVWRVQAENGKPFALKRVRLHGQDASAVQGYKGEIDLLNRLKGISRVVELYDYMIDDDKELLYVLMELGEGDLNKVLQARSNARDSREIAGCSSTLADTPRPIDFSFIRYWWTEMLQCVQAVHAQNIVHSDLKPANFLLVKGSLKLIDFGIAGAVDPQNTVNMYRDTHVGTPNYMSPESLQDSSMTNNPGLALQHTHPAVGRNMKIGKPSDVWSLGCILYQMVYSELPFGHISPPMRKVLAIINPHEHIAFPTHTATAVVVPPELRRTLQACLQRDPAKRPTVAHLLAPDHPWAYPESSPDLRISQPVLEQIILQMAKRFRDPARPVVSDDEVAKYAGLFYAKIRDHHEHSLV